MDPENVRWLLGIVVTCFGAVITYYVTRIDHKLDEQSKGMEEIKRAINTFALEFVKMEARITAVELHLWPNRRRFFNEDDKKE